MNVYDINNSDFNAAQLHEIQRLLGERTMFAQAIADEMVAFLDRCYKAAKHFSSLFHSCEYAWFYMENSLKYRIKEACDKAIAEILKDRDLELGMLVEKYKKRTAEKTAKKTIPRLAKDLVPIV